MLIFYVKFVQTDRQTDRQTDNSKTICPIFRCGGNIVEKCPERGEKLKVSEACDALLARTTRVGLLKKSQIFQEVKIS